MKSVKKILVIHKKSSLELAREYKNLHILDLVEKNDPSVCEYRKSHIEHNATLSFLKKYFKQRESLKVVFAERDKARINNESKNPYDLVLSVGGDGTFIWASKLLGKDTPIMGINSDPGGSVGFYTCATRSNFSEKFDSIINNFDDFPKRPVQRLAVFVNDKKVQNRVINDVLFAAAHPAAMTSYILRLLDESGEEILNEHQRSSGLWVSTPCGSTGANLSAGGWPLSVADTRMQFVVREPMKNFNDVIDNRTVHGFFDNSKAFTLVSKTRKALIAIDGTTITYPITTGDKIKFSISDEPLMVLGK